MNISEVPDGVRFSTVYMALGAILAMTLILAFSSSLAAWILAIFYHYPQAVAIELRTIRIFQVRDRFYWTLVIIWNVFLEMF